MKESALPDERMRAYLQKIATGPKMSKDLTAAEAEDGLRLVLDGAVSAVRAALFLIAARMKLETVEENLGFWRALDATTPKRAVAQDRLLQVADAFDGFERVPYFGFYAIPLIARLGLPAYGHSARPLAPKHGITFEDLLQNHYGAGRDQTLEQRAALIERFGFGYLGTEQSHPKLEALRDLREEIVKRPMLATLEKMLRPLAAKRNFLATNYFHPGYEVSMLAVAKESGFDTVIVGNGVEGGTLYGVHKPAKVFLKTLSADAEERRFDTASVFDEKTARRVREAFASFKQTETTREFIAQAGEAGLRARDPNAAALIATQAAVILWLLGLFPEAQAAYAAAEAALQEGAVYEDLMRYLDACKG